jgi:hypothetical protein
MAIQSSPGSASGADITPTRYTERRSPQFIGGNTDEPKVPSMSSMLAKTAGEAAGPYVGATIGHSIGSAVGGGAELGEASKEVLSNVGKVVSDPIREAAGKPVSEVGSALGTDALGGTIGGAAGAGLGSAVVGAVMGQQPKEYLPTAGASAVGFAIGNAILPGIGGFLGSAVGGLFCHAAGTMIRLEDGSLKAIEDLDFGDRVLLGGAIVGFGKVYASDLYSYRGTVVNGRHAVFEEGHWLRVQDSALATPLTGQSGLVYPVVTENHLLVCEQYICADLAETDNDIGSVGRLAILNADAERNKKLARAEISLGLAGVADAA